MNINFRAGYGNYQLNKLKQKEVTTEDTPLTNNGANTPDSLEMATVTGTAKTQDTWYDENGESFTTEYEYKWTHIYHSNNNNGMISPQAAELLKMNTMNFRQI